MTEPASLTHHQNGLPRQLNAEQLRELIREIVSSGGRVRYSRHSLDRMQQRGVTDVQALRVLQRGEVTEGPTWDKDRTNWRFTMRALSSGDDISVGATIDVEQLMGMVVVVITVIRE